MPSILNLSHNEAKKYFLDRKSYINFDLPDFYNFQKLLKTLEKKIKTTDIKDISISNPSDIEGVNYKIIGNKDGELAWRPFEIINPVLYIHLVNIITEENNWEVIKSRFLEFKGPFFCCESLAFKSTDRESSKAHQVRKWWENVEKKSIKNALNYQYVIEADISSCYESIYTHTISWALHGKNKAKAERNNDQLLGNQIDIALRMMRHGQTNGIPQGSVLMDFIAEIVLGYADELLHEKIEAINEKDDLYNLVRFRDDYKIFVNNPEFGKSILKELSMVLLSLGLKLNTQKTKFNDDPVLGAVKEDKIYELFIPDKELSLSKWLYQIYAASLKYPNSGMIQRQMCKYFCELEKVKKIGKNDDLELMISIVVNIALKNPKTYQWTMATLNKLVVLCTPEGQQIIVNRILDKFKKVPNTGLLDIWLQRITYKIDPNLKFNEDLACIVNGEKTDSIWELNWLKSDLIKLINDSSIIDRDELDKMKPLITKSEVALFRVNYF